MRRLRQVELTSPRAAVHEGDPHSRGDGAISYLGLPAKAPLMVAGGRRSPMTDCTIRLARDAAEWNELLAAVERPHLAQLWAYGEAKTAAGGVSRLSQRLSARRLVFERAAVPVAICQVLDRSVAGCCLASRIHRGPLLLGSRSSDDLAASVYGALRAHWRHRGVLLLSPALEASPEAERLLTRAGFRARHEVGWCSSVLDLRPSEQELRANLTHGWRNRLNQVGGRGLELRVSESQDALAWLLARHEENRHSRNFGDSPPRFVRALCAASPGDWFVCEARSADEPEPLAAMLVVQHGDWAEYYVAWFGDAGRRAGAGNFVYWKAALEARRRGVHRLDLGGYSATERGGLRQFKRGMRGTEYRLVREWLALPSAAPGFLVRPTSSSGTTPRPSRPS